MTDEPRTGATILGFGRRRRARSASAPVADLNRYAANSNEPDDYRHRMAVNAAAAVFVVLLVAAGIWIADTMAKIRKDQDCVLSGRRSCAPIDYRPASRP